MTWNESLLHWTGCQSMLVSLVVVQLVYSHSLVAHTNKTRSHLLLCTTALGTRCKWLGCNSSDYWYTHTAWQHRQQFRFTYTTVYNYSTSQAVKLNPKVPLQPSSKTKQIWVPCSSLTRSCPWCSDSNVGICSPFCILWRSWARTIGWSLNHNNQHNKQRFSRTVSSDTASSWYTVSSDIASAGIQSFVWWILWCNANKLQHFANVPCVLCVPWGRALLQSANVSNGFNVSFFLMRCELS